MVHNLARHELQEEPPRPVEAETWLRRALAVDSADTEGLYTLASALECQGRRQEAVAVRDEYEKKSALLTRTNRMLKDQARHASDDPNVLAELGTLLLSVSQERLGLHWLNQALAGDPGNQ